MEKTPALPKKRSRSSSVSSHPASQNGEKKKTKIAKATSKGDNVIDKKPKSIKNKIVKKSKETSGRTAKGKAIKMEKYQLRKGKILFKIILVSILLIIILIISR